MSTETPKGSLERLMKEWDAEVREHGIWTSGHSIAAKIVAALRASEGPREHDRCTCGHQREPHHVWGQCHGTFGENARHCKCTKFVLNENVAEGRQGTAAAQEGSQ
jgi:hypothetical protein